MLKTYMLLVYPNVPMNDASTCRIARTAAECLQLQAFLPPPAMFKQASYIFMLATALQSSSACKTRERCLANDGWLYQLECRLGLMYSAVDAHYMTLDLASLNRAVARVLS